MNDSTHNDKSIEFEINFLRRINEHDQKLFETINNDKVSFKETIDNIISKSNELFHFATSEEVENIFNQQAQPVEEV